MVRHVAEQGMAPIGPRTGRAQRENIRRTATRYGRFGVVKEKEPRRKGTSRSPGLRMNTAQIDARRASYC